MTAPARRSVKRRPKKVEPYWWFQGESVRELAKQLGAAGPDARLEVRIDAKRNMTLTVVAGEIGTAVHELDHINDSRVCPPICP